MSRLDSDAEFLKQFGEHLRRLRVERHLTQEGLAAQAGFSRSYYNEIETGKRNVALLNLKRLADCLGVQIHELLQLK